jgi:uncharacterized protein YidB (DUF937 family)
MQDIVKLVAEKTGLSESMAKTAVDTVLGFLKDKLPNGIGNQLDSFLGSGDGGKNDSPLGGILGGLGGILGK